MNNFIIAVMDRDSWNARTDIIIVVLPKIKNLLWIPRDVYSPLIKNRINVAYKIGKDKLLITVIQYLLNIIIKDCICILPKDINNIFNHIKDIKIPVNFDREFYYPLHRHEEIEKGRKIIQFKNPFENLTGDRFHEWIGARYTTKPNNLYGTDFDRIYRQQILVIEIINSNKMKNFSTESFKGINNKIKKIIKSIDYTWNLETLKFLKSRKIRNMDLLIYKNNL